MRYIVCTLIEIDGPMPDMTDSMAGKDVRKMKVTTFSEWRKSCRHK